MTRKDSRLIDWWNPAFAKLVADTSQWTRICNDLTDEHGKIYRHNSSSTKTVKGVQMGCVQVTHLRLTTPRLCGFFFLGEGAAKMNHLELLHLMVSLLTTQDDQSV